MKKMNVNYVAKTIELSEAFAKKAGIVGSPSYNELVEVQKAYPAYTVKVQKSKSKKPTPPKGITLELMRKYIEKHNEDNFLEQFDSLVENKASYFEIKDKVLKHYPECKTYKNRAEWILAA